MKPDALRAEFATPPMEYRPAPFWFWNDHLESKRLVEQFDALVDAGMGGAVLHARGGLDASEYLDETWFDAIGAVVERAAERGAKTWLYDELGWPSGSAGGRVLRAHPELRSMRLVMHDITAESASAFDAVKDENVVAAFVVVHTDPEHGILHRNDRGSPIAGAVTLLPDRIAYERIEWPAHHGSLIGRRLLIFEQRHDGSTIDYLDPRGAEAFLESTHEEYYRRFKQYFGTTITHAFMDEAGMLVGASTLPWTSRFASRFREQCGYDLVDSLPALFFDVPGNERVRFDFWSLATRMFREGFGVPMHRWCEQHGIHYSGHYVFETTLKEATRQLGSTMPLYEFQGMPGIDVLGGDFYSRRFAPEDYGMYTVMLKQAASVVHQLGKPGLMSESYGVGGHACGPEAMQTATNWQMALGVTFIAQHAAFYSMRGRRKLDHPPIIGWQQPYWRFIRKHVEAISRTGWLLSQGKHRSDVLVLHPQASMQATYRHFRNRAEYKAENYLYDADMPYELIDKHITLLSVALLDAQIDFDFGDEELLAKYGSVDESRLRIGDMRYRIVVMPPLVNIRSSTLELLRSFAAAGGTIFLVGSMPYLVDGKPSEDARWFLSEYAQRVDGSDRFDYSEIVAAISDVNGRTVVVRDAAGADVPQLKVNRRVWADREILYLANVSRDLITATVTLDFTFDGIVEEWDLSTGETIPFAACSKSEPLALELTWHPRQARVFVAIPGARNIPAPMRWREVRRIQPTWTGKRTEPNVLVLDAVTRIDDNGHSSIQSVADAQGDFKKRTSEQTEAPITFEYSFVVHSESERKLEGRLACEIGCDARATLNSDSIAANPERWFLDPAIRMLDAKYIIKGTNSFRVTDTYEQPESLQAAYLLGDFDVESAENVQFSVSTPRDYVPIGPWPKVGLPFYAGTVIYKATVEIEAESDTKYRLHLPGLVGSAEIRVNGEVVDHVLWPPYTCDITNYVHSGSNVVEIEVANTLRNLLGAHYNYDEETQAGISIASYSAPYGARKKFIDYGLLSAPGIVIEKPE